MKCPVVNLENKVVGEIELNDTIFNVPLRQDILARVVKWQLAKAQAGTHQTKGVSDVSGTTKKPFKQKGTGRARSGSLRSAQYRGGGVIFGPQSRDHSFKLPKKVRKLGLKVALSSKKASGDLVVLEDFNAALKTNELSKQLKTHGWDSVLFIDGAEVNENFARAAANIIHVDVLPQQGANVYSMLKRKVLVLSKDAVAQLEARLK